MGEFFFRNFGTVCVGCQKAILAGGNYVGIFLQILEVRVFFYQAWGTADMAFVGLLRLWVASSLNTRSIVM